ncbi:MAG: hypothetical protein R3E79_01235 [Caldilineaceae bacterium]
MNGFAVHFSEEAPGEGELDMATALACGTNRTLTAMLLEHLPSQPATCTGIDQVMQTRLYPRRPAKRAVHPGCPQRPPHCY